MTRLIFSINYHIVLEIAGWLSLCFLLYQAFKKEK